MTDSLGQFEQIVLTAILALETHDRALAEAEVQRVRGLRPTSSWPAHVSLSLRIVELMLAPDWPATRPIAVALVYRVLLPGLIDPIYRHLIELVSRG